MLITTEGSTTIKLNLKDFITRVTDFSWPKVKELDITDVREFEINGAYNHEASDYSNPITLTENIGWRSITSKSGSCAITYFEDMSFIEDQLDSFVTVGDKKSRLVLQNFIVVDDNDERIGTTELAKYLPSSFTELGDYGKNIFLDEQDEDYSVHDDVNDDLTGYIGKRFISTYNTNIIATVKELAVVQEEWGYGHTSPHESLKIELYKNYSGGFVCVRSLLSRIAGVATIQEAVFVNDMESVHAFFGDNDMANELYEITKQ